MNNFLLFFIIISWVLNFVYAKIPCDPDSFQFIEGHQFISKNKSYIFKIKNDEEIGCAINATYYWEVFDPQHKMRPMGHKVLSPSGLTREDNVVVSFSGLKNVYGKSYVIQVTLIPRPTHYPSYRLLHIKVSLEEYNIEIVGGRVREHRLGKGVLWMNVTVTRETGKKVTFKRLTWICKPTFKQKAPQLLNWKVFERYLIPNQTYHCMVIMTITKKRYLVAEQQIHMSFPLSTSIAEVICVENCIPGNASHLKATVLRYICRASCDAEPIWIVDPPNRTAEDRFQYESDRPTYVIIPPKTFEPGMTYKIMLELGRTISNYTLTYRMPRMQLHLNCIANCFKSDLRITLQVTCSGECEGVKYFWEVMDYPKLELFLIKTYNIENDKLTFNAKSFLPYSGAYVIARSISNFTEFKFTTDEHFPIIKIKCIENCHPSLTQTQTKLTAECIEYCNESLSFSWNFQPEPKRVVYLNDNATVLVMKNSFIKETNMAAQVYVNKRLGDLINISFVMSFSIKIVCVDNCDSRNASRYDKSVTVKVNCKGTCQGIEYSWVVYPPPVHSEKYFSILNKTRVLFLPKFYYDNEVPTAFITISGSGQSASMQLTFEQYRPLIRIICMQNCWKNIVTNEDTVLQAYCVRNCANIQFSWFLDPPSFGEHWHDHIELSFRNATLTLKKNSFRPLDKFIVVLESSPRFSEALLAILYADIDTRLRVSCIFNCHSWVHLAVVLKVECIAKCPKKSHFTWTIDPKPDNDYPFIKSEEDQSANFGLEANSYTTEKHVQFTARLGTVKAAIVIHFKKLFPKIKIDCQPRACHKYHNPLSDVIISAVCLKDCKTEDIQWELSPLPDNFVWTEHVIANKEMKKVILAGTFEHQSNVSVITNVVGGSQKVLLKFRYPQPEFVVVCLDNCGLSDPHVKTRLAVDCSWFCDIVDVYSWSFIPPPPRPLFNILFSPLHLEAVIDASVYDDGDIVFVNVSWSIYSSIYKIPFVERAPVLDLICLENCEFIILRHTIFRIECVANCSTPDDVELIILSPPANKARIRHSNQVLLIPKILEHEERKYEIALKKGKGYNSFVIEFKDPNYHLYIKCTSNCDYGFSIPTYQTVFEVNCIKNCKDDMQYKWSIDQEPILLEINHDIIIDQSTKVMTLRAYLFHNDSTIIVRASSDGVVAKYEVTFLQPTPHIQIICDANCGYHDPEVAVVFSPFCFSHCYNLTYAWDIFSENPQRKMPDSFELEKRRTTLIIPANIYSDEDAFIIRLTVGQVFTERVARYAANPPKFYLICRPNCSSLDPGSTVEIKIICVKYCHYSTQYAWSLSPFPNNSIWELDLILKKRNTSLTIKGGSYKNGSSVEVVVVGMKGSYAFTRIKYVKQPPHLSITCKSNCEFLSGTPIILNIHCKGFCEELEENLICKMQHHLLKNFIYTSTYIKIVNTNLDLDDQVVITCVALGSLVSYRFTFKSTSWNGTCVVTPTVGLSGTTLHSVGCTGFNSNATYTYMQNFPKLTFRGVYFYKGKNNYIDNIFLGPGWPYILRVQITHHWVLKKVIFLQVYSKTFLIKAQMRYERQGILNKNLPSEEWTRESFLEKVNLCLYLLDTGQIRKGYEVALMLETEVKYMPDDIGLHFHTVVTKKLLNTFNFHYPFQFLSLIELFITDKATSKSYLITVINLVYNIAKKVYIWSHPNQTEAQKRGREMYGQVFIQLIEKIMLANKELLDQDKRDKISLELGFTNYEYHLELTSTQIMDIAVDLLGSMKNETTYKTRLFVVKTIKCDTQKPYIRLQSKPNQSFIEFHPNIYASNSKDELLVKFVTFNINLHEALTDVNYSSVYGEMNYFAANKMYEPCTYGPVKVYVKFKNPKKYETIKLNLVSGDFKIWKLDALTYSTLEIKVKGNHSLYVGIGKPNRDYVESNGISIPPLTSIFYVVIETPTYIGISGSGPIILEFMGMQCVSYVGTKAGQKHMGCSVGHPQPKNPYYVLCECKDLMPVSSASMFLPPYEETSSNQKLTVDDLKNYSFAVFTITLCVGILMAAIFALAIFIEKKSKDELIFLNENEIAFKYIYVIAVQTGIWKNSGTTANVSIRLYGKKGVSKIHVFNNLRKDILQRNSADCFLMFSQSQLGEIYGIQIWHDSFGERPEWFCESIVVQNLQTFKRYIFLVFRWFTIVKPPYTAFGFFVRTKKLRNVGLWAKFVSSIRWNHCNLSFLNGRRSDWTYTQQAAISFSSILAMMATCSLIIDVSRNSVTDKIEDVGIIVGIGSFITIILNVLFCCSSFSREFWIACVNPILSCIVKFGNSINEFKPTPPKFKTDMWQSV